MKFYIKHKNSFLLPICCQNSRSKKDKVQYKKYIVYLPKELIKLLKNKKYLEVKS